MSDDNISTYYRYLYAKEHLCLNGDQPTKLARPVFGAHISVIRGERIPNYHLWGLSSNQIIEFEYQPGVLNNHEYYWLKVRCSFLSELRLQYGLPPEPKYGFHLTIGRTI